eukprot:GHUV01032117.1.p1 GENE.GHUV01032117.1~~GHUV01032117.1.p1  ORF type:complete len:180 (+),score=30.92 GHUV01032117.1:136-675(+)
MHMSSCGSLPDNINMMQSCCSAEMHNLEKNTGVQRCQCSSTTPWFDLDYHILMDGSMTEPTFPNRSQHTYDLRSTDISVDILRRTDISVKHLRCGDTISFMHKGLLYLMACLSTKLSSKVGHQTQQLLYTRMTAAVINSASNPSSVIMSTAVLIRSSVSTLFDKTFKSATLSSGWLCYR